MNEQNYLCNPYTLTPNDHLDTDPLTSWNRTLHMKYYINNLLFNLIKILKGTSQRMIVKKENSNSFLVEIEYTKRDFSLKKDFINIL